MFPYLRTKYEFLKDSESISYRITKTDNKYKIDTLNDAGFYNRIRGCKRDNPRCKGCETYIECYPFRAHPREKKSDAYTPCRECSNMSELIAWLINGISSADWHKLSDKNIGRVSFSEVHAWCQSVGIYMHEVVKSLEADNIIIGLECYKDDSNTSNTRADMMIAGYDRLGNPRIVIIELKQWDDIYINETGSIKLISPIKQVSNYATLMQKNASEAGIDIIPCVYIHNLRTDALSELKERALDGLQDTNVGDYRATHQIYEVNDIQWDVKTFYRDSDITAFLNDIFSDDSLINGNGAPALDIIRNLKKQTKIFSVDDIARIMLDIEDNSWDESIVTLRPDQKVAYDEIKNKIESGENFIDIINGTSGSGKTLIAAFLIRYCIQNNKRVAFLYHGTAPVNALFTPDLFRDIIWSHERDDSEDVAELFYHDKLAESFVLGRKGNIVTIDDINSIKEYVEEKIEEVRQSPESERHYIVKKTIEKVKRIVPLIMYDIDSLRVTGYEGDEPVYEVDPDYPPINYLKGILEDLEYWESNIYSYEDKLPESIKKWKEYCTVEHYSDFIKQNHEDIPNDEGCTEDEAGDGYRPYDIIIFDEFHRFQGTDDDLMKLTNMATGKLLFIDGRQEIDKGDRGSECVDKLISDNENACTDNLIFNNENVTVRQLWSQFRCNFQEGYISWVDQILQFEKGLRGSFLAGQRSAGDRIYLSDLDFDVHIVNQDELKDIVAKPDVVCLSEADENELDEVLGEGHYTIVRNNGIVEPFDSEGKKNICKSFKVQGIEYDNILVIIDSNIKIVNGAVIYDGNDRISWDGYVPRSVIQKIVDEYGDGYVAIRDNFLTNNGRLRARVRWSELSNVVHRLASECENYSERDFENFDDCYIKMKYYYPICDRELRIMLQKYRVLLTRGLKSCYIYAVDDDMRRYLMAHANRPDF